MSATHPATAMRQFSRPTLRSWTTDHQVGAFFTLTFIISWTMWLFFYITGENALGYIFFGIGGFGPLISAATITRYTGSSVGEWARRIIHWRVPARWYLYAFGLPVLIWTFINLELALLGEEIDVSLLPSRLLPALGSFLLVLTVGG